MRKYIQIFFLVLFSFQLHGQNKLEEVVLKDKVSKITETYYVNSKNIRQGEYKFYYKKQEQIIGNYKDNLKSGMWIYMPSIDFKFIGEFEDDLKTNQWIYIEKGDTITILNYKNDKLNGKQIGYFNNGQKATELNYSEGDRHGIEKRYYKNGEIKEILNYRHGDLHGDYLIYSENGKLITKLIFHNNVPIHLENYTNDTSRIFYTGKLQDGNGVLNTMTVNQETNNIQTYLIRTIKDSLLHGRIQGRDYYGNLSFTGQYYQGFLNGNWKFYDSKGRIEKNKSYSYTQKLTEDSTEARTKIHEKRFNIEETMPRFDGERSQGFTSYLDQNINYPAKCQKNKIQGRVFVQFVVNRHGQIIDSKVSRGVHPLLDAEAKRVIDIMPLWIPGIQSGIPVKVQFNCPILFRLN